jgi:toxin ParE1/3/4
MAFEVFLTDDAAKDIEELYDYIARQDAPENAEHAIAHIEKAVGSLSKFPQRGVYPGELAALGIRDYREIFFKPYRIIYRVMGGAVYVYLIVDGRRDIQTLLQRRLLEA